MGSALLRGHYEPFGTRLFTASLKLGMTVIDCGANIGIYTALASGSVGSTGKVYAFEPEPRNFSCLEEMIRLNQLGNVQPEHVALSDRNEETNLYLADMNMGDHRLTPTEDARQSVRIETRTLDSYWSGEIPAIDILKLDVQGAEGLVLRGMSETIAKSPKLKIFMEFWPYGLNRSGTNPKALLESLLKQGFSIQRVDQDRGKLHHVDHVAELLAVDDEETSFDLYLER